MYMISLLQGMVFYASISTLYRLDRGLSLTEYAITDSISYIFALVMEIPWGIIADRIGYRKTLIIANGFYFLSKITFWRADSFVLFLLERFLLSMAFAGVSGVDVSILYLSAGKQDSHKAFSRYGGFSTAGVLISSLAFTMFNLTYEQTAIYTVIAYGIAFILSFMLAEVKDSEQLENRKHTFLPILKSTLADWRFIIMMAGASLCSMGTWTISVFLNQEKYLSAGLPQRYIGLALVLTTIISFCGVFSADIAKRFGTIKTGVGLLVILTGAALLLAFTGSLPCAFIGIGLTEAMYSLFTPFLGDLENQRVFTDDRATQLSIYTMAMDVFSILPDILIGRIADFSMKAAFITSAVFFTLALGAFLLCFAGGHKSLNSQKKIVQ